MEKLWEANPDYTGRVPISFEDWVDFNSYAEKYFPYKRLHRTLNLSQLLKLIQDAYRNHWQALDLRDCGLDSLPGVLNLPELRFLALGNWDNDPRNRRNRFSELPASIGKLRNYSKTTCDINGDMLN